MQPIKPRGRKLLKAATEPPPPASVEGAIDRAIHDRDPDARVDAVRDISARLQRTMLSPSPEVFVCMMMEGLMVVATTDPILRCRVAAGKAIDGWRRLNWPLADKTEELKDVAISAITRAEVVERLAPLLTHLARRHRLALLPVSSLVPVQRFFGTNWRDALTAEMARDLAALTLRRWSVEEGRCERELERRGFERDAAWARAIGRAYARGVEGADDERQLRSLLKSSRRATRERLAPLARVLPDLETHGDDFSKI